MLVDGSAVAADGTALPLAVLPQRAETRLVAGYQAAEVFPAETSSAGCVRRQRPSISWIWTVRHSVLPKTHQKPN